MIEDLARISDLGQAVLWSGFLVFLRIGGMMAFLPVFGEQSIPVRIRLGLTVAFMMIVMPAVASGPELPLNAILGLSYAGSEIAIGLFLGLILRFFVFALQMAGAIAAQSTSLSQIFGGSAGADPQPAMGHLLTIAGFCLAVMLGLHVRFAVFMIESYTLIPAGTGLNARTLSGLGVERAAGSFVLGFSLAAPFVVASLIYNVTLGVINRAMPQLMVSFVGAPVITAGALVLFAAASPLLLGLWVDALDQFIADPFGG